MDLLKRIRSVVTHTINHAESVVHKAKVETLRRVEDPALNALPEAITEALQAHATSALEHRVVPPRRMMLATAAKADLAAAPAVAPAGQPAVPETAVAFRTDDDGFVHWHLPDARGSLPVWVPRGAREGLKFVVARFPDGLDAIRFIDRALNKPSMKGLPVRSHAPEVQAAPQAPNIPLAVFRDGPSAPIPPGAPVLILVHGIFDRVYGAAFSPLLLWGDLLGRLQSKYGNRVYGFDHETLTVDPRKNAEDLLALLPSNTQIDILCHSRGGLVTRALLQHPDFQQRLGTDIKIRNVIFMGAANEGSPLAQPGHREDLLKIFTGMVVDMAPEERMAAHLNLLVKAVQVLLAPAFALPGLIALQPGSDLIQALSGKPLPPDVKCTFIRANFGNALRPASRAAEAISDNVFNGAPHDLVVPFDGMTAMGGGPQPQKGQIETIGDEGRPQGHVYHLNYLDQQRVRDRITAFLEVP